MEIMLNMHNREELMNALDDPALNIIPDDIKHIPDGHYIYIFVIIANFNQYREVKIGRTSNLYKLIQCYRRLTQKCELVFYRDCKDKDDVILIERLVFRKLKHHRVNHINEQFILPPQSDIKDFIYIINQCIDFTIDTKETGMMLYSP